MTNINTSTTTEERKLPNGWAFCVVEDNGSFCFVIEGENRPWKKKWQIWIPWWWIESGENEVTTIKRELMEEAWVNTYTGLTKIGVIQVLYETEPKNAIFFGLHWHFKKLENEEVTWTSYTVAQIKNFLLEENWYLKFRPWTLEALWLYFKYKNHDSQTNMRPMVVKIENSVYETRPSILKELISLLDTWSSPK